MNHRRTPRGGLRVPSSVPAVLALLTLAPGAGSLAAQVEGSRFSALVTGVVLDQETGTPLQGAYVSVVALDWYTLSDAGGRFRLPDVPIGLQFVEVKQLGYQEIRIGFEVEPGLPPLEVRVPPDPVVMEGITVMTDRFTRRRNAVPMAVRAYYGDWLQRSASLDVAEFLRNEAFVTMTWCPPGYFQSRCVLSRGSARPPAVYIDEMPRFGGLDELETYRPHELYLVEVYGGGRQIRAYTHQFMEQIARRPRALLPIIF